LAKSYQNGCDFDMNLLSHIEGDIKYAADATANLSCRTIGMTDEDTGIGRINEDVFNGAFCVPVRIAKYPIPFGTFIALAGYG